MLLVIAALLPSLFWDKGPETAPALKSANIEAISVPRASVEKWRDAGFHITEASPDCKKLAAPKVNYRFNVASASSSPWIDSNGWHYLRDPHARFCVEANGQSAALAAAEIYAYDAAGSVQSDSDGLAWFGRMLQFLRDLPKADLPALANIGLIDDGSAQTGELMNLLSRRNLLFRIVSVSDPKLNITVKLGSEKYPAAVAADPSKLAYQIRQDLTDEKRLLRIYGSEVVIGRLIGDGKRVRLHLLNCAQRPVTGLRVRILGSYPKGAIRVFDVNDAKLADYEAQPDATEFTVVQMNSYAVIDLTR